MADPVCVVCGGPWYGITRKLYQIISPNPTNISAGSPLVGSTESTLAEILKFYNIDPAIDNCCLLKLKSYISGQNYIHQKYNNEINNYVQ